MSSDKGNEPVGNSGASKVCLTCIINQFVEKANTQLKIFSTQHSETCPGLPPLLLNMFLKKKQNSAKKKFLSEGIPGRQCE